MKPEPKGTGVLYTKCIHDKEHEYSYSWELETYREAVTNAAKQKWCFCIIEDGEVFQFDIVDEGHFMRVEHMDNNENVQYSAKGIPEAFIRLSRQIFRLPICSSVRALPQPRSPGIASVAEQRSDDATKMWQRLVDKGEAYFSNDTQRFTYPLKEA